MSEQLREMREGLEVNVNDPTDIDFREMVTHGPKQVRADNPATLSCSGCRFFDVLPSKFDGLCRRNAPKDYLPFPGGLHETGEVQAWETGTQWPIVYVNDWCGEHSDLQGGANR